MPRITPKIPQGLEELMLNLAKSIIKENPQNLYEFAAEYFEKLLKERDGKVDESYKKLPVYKAYKRAKLERNRLEVEGIKVELEARKRIGSAQTSKSFSRSSSATKNVEKLPKITSETELGTAEAENSKKSARKLPNISGTATKIAVGAVAVGVAAGAVKPALMAVKPQRKSEENVEFNDNFGGSQNVEENLGVLAQNASNDGLNGTEAENTLEDSQVDLGGSGYAKMETENEIKKSEQNLDQFELNSADLEPTSSNLESNSENSKIYQENSTDDLQSSDQLPQINLEDSELDFAVSEQIIENTLVAPTNSSNTDLNPVYLNRITENTKTLLETSQNLDETTTTNPKSGHISPKTTENQHYEPKISPVSPTPPETTQPPNSNSPDDFIECTTVDINFLNREPSENNDIKTENSNEIMENIIDSNERKVDGNVGDKTKEITEIAGNENNYDGDISMTDKDNEIKVENGQNVDEIAENSEKFQDEKLAKNPSINSATSGENDYQSSNPSIKSSEFSNLSNESVKYEALNVSSDTQENQSFEDNFTSNNEVRTENLQEKEQDSELVDTYDANLNQLESKIEEPKELEPKIKEPNDFESKIEEPSEFGSELINKIRYFEENVEVLEDSEEVNQDMETKFEKFGEIMRKIEESDERTEEDYVKLSEDVDNDSGNLVKNEQNLGEKLDFKAGIDKNAEILTSDHEGLEKLDENDEILNGKAESDRVAGISTSEPIDSEHFKENDKIFKSKIENDQVAGIVNSEPIDSKKIEENDENLNSNTQIGQILENFTIDPKEFKDINEKDAISLNKAQNDQIVEIPNNDSKLEEDLQNRKKIDDKIENSIEKDNTTQYEDKPEPNDENSRDNIAIAEDNDEITQNNDEIAGDNVENSEYDLEDFTPEDPNESSESPIKKPSKIDKNIEEDSDKFEKEVINIENVLDTSEKDSEYNDDQKDINADICDDNDSMVLNSDDIINFEDNLSNNNKKSEDKTTKNLKTDPKINPEDKNSKNKILNDPSDPNLTFQQHNPPPSSPDYYQEIDSKATTAEMKDDEFIFKSTLSTDISKIYKEKFTVDTKKSAQGNESEISGQNDIELSQRNGNEAATGSDNVNVEIKAVLAKNVDLNEAQNLIVDEEEKDKAAVKIQSMFRGYQVRKTGKIEQNLEKISNNKFEPKIEEPSEFGAELINKIKDFKENDEILEDSEDVVEDMATKFEKFGEIMRKIEESDEQVDKDPEELDGNVTENSKDEDFIDILLDEPKVISIQESEPGNRRSKRSISPETGEIIEDQAKVEPEDSWTEGFDCLKATKNLKNLTISDFKPEDSNNIKDPSIRSNNTKIDQTNPKPSSIQDGIDEVDSNFDGQDNQPQNSQPSDSDPALNPHPSYPDNGKVTRKDNAIEPKTILDNLEQIKHNDNDELIEAQIKAEKNNYEDTKINEIVSGSEEATENVNKVVGLDLENPQSDRIDLVNIDTIGTKIEENFEELRNIEHENQSNIEDSDAIKQLNLDKNLDEIIEDDINDGGLEIRSIDESIDQKVSEIGIDKVSLKIEQLKIEPEDFSSSDASNDSSGFNYEVLPSPPTDSPGNSENDENFDEIVRNLSPNQNKIDEIDQHFERIVENLEKNKETLDKNLNNFESNLENSKIEIMDKDTNKIDENSTNLESNLEGSNKKDENFDVSLSKFNETFKIIGNFEDNLEKAEKNLEENDKLPKNLAINHDINEKIQQKNGISTDIESNPENNAINTQNLENKYKGSKIDAIDLMQNLENSDENLEVSNQNPENLNQNPEISNQNPESSNQNFKESSEPPENTTRNAQIFDKYLDIYDENLENFEFFTNNPDGTLKKSHKIVEKLNEIIDDEVAKYVEKMEAEHEGTEPNDENLGTELSKNEGEAQFDVFEYAVPNDDVEEVPTDKIMLPKKSIDLPLVFKKGEDKALEVEIENNEILTPEPKDIEEPVIKQEIRPQLSGNIPIPHKNSPNEVTKIVTKDHKNSNEKENAALKIQSFFRGFKVRKSSKPKKKSAKEPSIFGNELVEKIQEFEVINENLDNSEENVEDMETKFEKFGEILKKIEESDEKNDDKDAVSTSNLSEQQSKNLEKKLDENDSNLKELASKEQYLVKLSSDPSKTLESQESSTSDPKESEKPQDYIPTVKILNPLQGFEKLTQKFEHKLEENSAEQAAVKIQSLFRGFKVRKSQPPRKYKQNIKELSAFGSELVDKIEEFEEIKEKSKNSEEVVEDMEVKFEKFGEIMRKIEESEEGLDENTGKIGENLGSNAEKLREKNEENFSSKDDTKAEVVEEIFVQKDVKSVESQGKIELNDKNDKNSSNFIKTQKIEANPHKLEENSTNSTSNEDKEPKNSSTPPETTSKPSNNTEETNAAVKIQSFFRGFNVRKSNPSKKQKIQEPSEFGSELVEKIQDFEENKENLENSEENLVDLEEKFEKFGEIMRKIEESEEKVEEFDEKIKNQEGNSESFEKVIFEENIENLNKNVEETGKDEDLAKDIANVDQNLKKTKNSTNDQEDSIDIKLQSDHNPKSTSLAPKKGTKQSKDDETNAAVKIQSFFRGFKVRKSHKPKPQESSAFGAELIEKIEELDAKNENFDEYVEDMEAEFEKFGEIMKKIEESEKNDEHFEKIGTDKLKDIKSNLEKIEKNSGNFDGNSQKSNKFSENKKKFEEDKAKFDRIFGKMNKNLEIIDKNAEKGDEKIEISENKFENSKEILENSDENFENSDNNFENSDNHLEDFDKNSSISKENSKTPKEIQRDSPNSKNDPQNTPKSPLTTNPPRTPEKPQKNLLQNIETDQMSGEYEEVDQLSTIYEQNSVEEEACIEKIISYCGPNLEQNVNELDEKINCEQEENRGELGLETENSELNDGNFGENLETENEKLIGKISKKEKKINSTPTESETQNKSQKSDIKSQKFVKIGDKFVIVEENPAIIDDPPKTDHEVLENLAISKEKLSKLSEKMSKSPAKNSKLEVTSENFEEISKQFDQISREYDKLYKKIEEKFEESSQVLQEKTEKLGKSEKFDDKIDSCAENNEGKNTNLEDCEGKSEIEEKMRNLGENNSGEKLENCEENPENLTKIDPNLSKTDQIQQNNQKLNQIDSSSNPKPPQINDKNQTEEAKAAVKIQSTFRGYKVRKSRFQKFKDNLSEKFNLKTEPKVEEPSVFGSELMEKIKDFEVNEENLEDSGEVVENMEEKFEKFSEIMRKIEESGENGEELDEKSKIQEENCKKVLENDENFEENETNLEKSLENFKDNLLKTKKIEKSFENSVKNLENSAAKLENFEDKNKKFAKKEENFEKDLLNVGKFENNLDDFEEKLENSEKDLKTSSGKLENLENKIENLAINVKHFEQNEEKFTKNLEKSTKFNENSTNFAQNSNFDANNLDANNQNDDIADDFDMDSLEYEANFKNFTSNLNENDQVAQNDKKSPEIDQNFDNLAEKSSKIPTSNFGKIPQKIEISEPKSTKIPQKSSKIPIKQQSQQKLSIKSESLPDYALTDSKSINKLSHSTDHTPLLSPISSDPNLLRRQSYIDSVIHQIEGSHVIEGGLIGYGDQFDDLQAANVENLGRDGDFEEDGGLRMENEGKNEDFGGNCEENLGKIEESSQNLEENSKKSENFEAKIKNSEKNDEKLQNLKNNPENFEDIEKNQENVDDNFENQENLSKNSEQNAENIENKINKSLQNTLKKPPIFPQNPTSSSSSHQKVIPIAKVQPENIKALTSKSHPNPEPEASHPKQISVPNHAKQTKNSIMRQKTMPVQFESSVMRVLPKHLRKRIQSAEGEKKKKRPVLMQ